MKIKDILFLPVRLLLNHNQVSALGLTSLLQERMDICAKYIKTPVLDIGCGEENYLIKQMGIKGYGLDVFPFRSINVCADSRCLPFKEKTFQSVSFIGSFNYMKNRENVLGQVKRVLDKQGVLLITITAVFWSKLRHSLAWWRKEQYLIAKDGKYGFSIMELEQLLESEGFRVIKKVNYFFGISTLFIVSPRG